MRLLSRGGAAVVFETVVSRLDRGGLLGSLHDISARKRAEVEREEAQRRYRAILDHSSHFIGLLDLQGRLIDANLTALRFAGVDAAQVLGIPFWDTLWWSHSPSEQAKLRDAIERAIRGEAVRF
ncbi:MAG: PAS domain S-box protein, partial [Gammaproteobacteria bacterium]|nr:PAS domain S-box protein [Gammaproteobacteria bacterium]